MACERKGRYLSCTRPLDRSEKSSGLAKLATAPPAAAALKALYCFGNMNPALAENKQGAVSACSDLVMKQTETELAVSDLNITYDSGGSSWPRFKCF